MSTFIKSVQFDTVVTRWFTYTRMIIYNSEGRVIDVREVRNGSYGIEKLILFASCHSSYRRKIMNDLGNSFDTLLLWGEK
jgi:hypothetical protein